MLLFVVTWWMRLTGRSAWSASRELEVLVRQPSYFSMRKSIIRRTTISVCTSTPTTSTYRTLAFQHLPASFITMGARCCSLTKYSNSLIGAASSANVTTATQVCELSLQVHLLCAWKMKTLSWTELSTLIIYVDFHSASSLTCVQETISPLTNWRISSSTTRRSLRRLSKKRIHETISQSIYIMVSTHSSSRRLTTRRTCSKQWTWWLKSMCCKSSKLSWSI